MPQRHPIRHQRHGNMAVMFFCHQLPDFVRNVRKRRKQFSTFAPQLFSPAESRGRVALRMPEHQRRVPLVRVIAAGYGVQIADGEGLRTPGAVRERPRAGDFDPFVVHTKSPCFPVTMTEKQGPCPERARSMRTNFRRFFGSNSSAASSPQCAGLHHTPPVDQAIPAGWIPARRPARPARPSPLPWCRYRRPG